MAQLVEALRGLRSRVRFPIMSLDFIIDIILPHLKEKALDCTVWRARFGRGFGPVVRQTTK